jgi:tetratricopeptide (TPR) repeat protein
VRRLFLPLLFLLAPASLRAQGKPADEEIYAGRQDFEAGRYADAAVHFARAAQIDPLDWRGSAYHSLTLVQEAQETSDMRQREAYLREAERVAGDLVKRGLVEFHDPLYRFVRGVVYSLEGDQGKAYETLGEALRAPRDKFLPYREISLHRMLLRAHAVAGTRVAMGLIAQGRFEAAETVLQDATTGIPEGDSERPLLERLLAAACENQGKPDQAIEHLRKCMELAKDQPGVKEELTATIALIYLVKEELDKGRAVLDELPKDSRQPDVIAARCTLVVKEALRDRGGKLDEAFAYVKDAMRSYPPENVYRLVLLYRTLLEAKVGPREAQTPEGKALLEEAIPIYKREIDRRPECPPLYYALYQIYKLLGDADEAKRYEDLHERKKKDFEHQEKYDAQGRPRCGS